MSMGGGKEDRAMRRFKFDGAVKGYYDVKVFDRGDWMDWLELCHQLDQLRMSWQLTTSDDDTNKLVCIVRQVIFNHDLRLFNAAFTAATQQHQQAGDQAGMLNQALTAGLAALTKRHCPFDVTTRLRQKLSDLRKTRDMPVDEYTHQFEYLLELGAFVELNVSGNDQIALFHRGMPTAWRERVEFVAIRKPADALLELRMSYKVCERLEESRSPFGQAGRGGKRGRFDKRAYSKREKKQGSQAQSRHEMQAKTKDERSQHSQGKRKRESDQDKGCSYCEDQGMPFYQNHRNADCFRNPNSPSYRPNANKRVKKDTSADRKPAREMAAAQFHPSPDDDSDEDLDDIYAGIPCGDVSDAAVARTTTASSRKAQVRVQLRHPLSKKTVVALLDSGCDTSMVAKEIVSWYTPQQPQGKYRNASGKLEDTYGCIDLPFKVEDFGASRQMNDEFQIADQLLYPIMLGTDFMEEQGIKLDWKNHKIYWDGATIPLGTPAPQSTVLFAEMNEDGRVDRILNAEGKEVDIDALVPRDTLTLEQQQRLQSALNRVKVAFVGPVGKLDLPPYVLPVKSNAIPSAQAPYSVPHKLHAPTLKELERLVRLGILEPDKDSPWASPAFVIPKTDGSVRFLSDFRRLNKWLERRYFPLPKIQDMLRELPRPVFVTTLDLVMGYYSREIAMQSRPFTAIVLPWGKYRYCRLPMGISTAPDEFHAVITQLLGDLTYVRIYLDDVLILSQTFDEHLHHIEVVMDPID